MLLVIFSLLSTAASCIAKENVLAEWDFSQAYSTLGWTSAGGVIGFDKVEGALTAKGDGCKLISPLFDIKAAPLQYVEIEMSCNADGHALMYYSNTTEEPYLGFRPGLYHTFSVKGDGQFRTYALRPFWHGQGKIIHVRFDPPGTDTAIRAIRIMEPEPGPSTKTDSWEFRGTALGWSAQPDGAVETLASGLRIKGNRDTLVLSPALDLQAEQYSWAKLRISATADQTSELKWITLDSGGLKRVPILLRGDGKTHSYAINLKEIGDWAGTILAMGLSPTESSDSQPIVVESISLGDKPTGQPELQVKSLQLEDPYPRVGELSKVLLSVTNVGGETPRNVRVEVQFSGRIAPTSRETVSADAAGNETTQTETSSGKWKTTLTGGIVTIAPGVTRQPEGEWKLSGQSEGMADIVCTISADGMEPLVYKSEVRFYPKLDSGTIKSLTYVPKPRPADTGEYLVGCYNYPGWRDYGAWSVLDKFPERRPLLGYYPVGSPEVNDWQITWALDHGINFLIYDWYWEQGRRHLEEGLHDGFLRAKYQDKMKFCLLWANHNQPKTSSYDDCINVTKYWIENYFKRPNYLKLGGKNVMVIFSPNRMLDDMGAAEVRRAFTDMRKLCKDSGVGGLYMVACVWPQPHWIKLCADAGFDALSGYNYPSAGDKGQLVAPYSWMVDGYQQFWEEISSQSSIPYIPLCEAGWDSRPWHGPQARQRTGKTPELWQKMLTNAKSYLDDPKHKLAEGRKLVFMEAWNEYGEGDYIEPHRQFGFDYLEAVRQVFAPKSKSPVIVLPKDIVLGPYDLKKPVPVTAWDFGDAKARTWLCDGSAAPLSYPNGALRADIVTNDPRLWGPPVEIDAAKLKTLEIKMKISAADEAQLFFGATRSGFSERSSVKFAVKGDNQFHVYRIDLGANPLWNGTIGALRFDPCSKPGAKVEIAYIKVR